MSRFFYLVESHYCCSDGENQFALFENKHDAENYINEYYSMELDKDGEFEDMARVYIIPAFSFDDYRVKIVPHVTKVVAKIGD